MADTDKCALSWCGRQWQDIHRAKSGREQTAQVKSPYIARAVPQENAGGRVGKFGYALTAGATGRTEYSLRSIGEPTHHGNPPDPLATCHTHRADRARLGAYPYRVGSILNIAPNMDRARLVLDRDADAKMGIWGIGALPHLDRPLKQLVLSHDG
jgi:hypothetical protein